MVEIVNWESLNNPIGSALLMGNGFSRSISGNFSYETLFQYSSDQGLMDQAVADIFTNFRSVNFEEVLDKLNTAKTILTSLGNYEVPVRQISLSHNRVKNSLIESVNHLHPANMAIRERLLSLNAHLRGYKKVFTTNYDLLLYWALMANETGFKDYFWNRDLKFDSLDTDSDDNSTLVHYLHGALHLYRNLNGEIVKLTAATDLLTSIRESIQNDNYPLFISEGDYSRKLKKIRASDYLSFCYKQFSKARRKIVIFGHSLSEDYDLHLFQALKVAYEKSIGTEEEIELYVSVYGQDQEAADRIDLCINQHVSRHVERFFFDSVTHPLGNI